MTSYESNLINKLNQLIVDKYINAESITDDLCHDLGISRSNLYRLLKENFQTSPSLYIRKIKLKKAEELLNNFDLKINEIAYSIGIDSPQNFTKYFTQQFGVNPTEYRKKINNSKNEVSIEINETEAVEKPFVPLINRKKQKFTDNLSFYIPGLVVLVLTTFGFYYWQKSYFNNENNLPFDKNNSLVILGFDCFGFEKRTTLCDSLNNEFRNAFLKIENIKMVNSELIDSSKAGSYNKFVNEMKVKYFLTGNIISQKNEMKLKIDLLEGFEKKVVWSKNFNLFLDPSDNNLNEIIKETISIFKTNPIITKNEKFYLIPNRNMNTYKQFLQSSQLIFNWDSLNYVQK